MRKATCPADPDPDVPLRIRPGAAFPSAALSTASLIVTVVKWAGRDALGKTAPGSFAYAQPMAVYQLRYFDAFSGNIVRARDFEAETDQAATAYADDARGLAPMELWERDRKITQWGA